MTDLADYTAHLEAWRQKRLAALKAPNGWLNIIGRWWLEPGTVTVGSAADNDIVPTIGPARLGTLTQAPSGHVSFTPANGEPTIELEPNKKKPPNFLLEGLLVEITTMNGDNALRIRDTNSTAPNSSRPSRAFRPTRTGGSLPTGYPMTSRRG